MNQSYYYSQGRPVYYSDQQRGIVPLLLGGAIGYGIGINRPNCCPRPMPFYQPMPFFQPGPFYPNQQINVFPPYYRNRY